MEIRVTENVFVGSCNLLQYVKYSVCVCVYMYIYTVYIYVCVYICIYVYMYTYIYIHTHTQMQLFVFVRMKTVSRREKSRAPLALISKADMMSLYWPG